MLTLSEHMSSSSIFSRVRVAQSLVFCVVFCRSLFCSFVIFLLAIVLSVLLRFTASVYPFGIFKLFLSFCHVSFGHCVVCPSSIYCFCLPLWYLQTLLVLLSFFSSPLCCLSFFDLQLLFTPLVSSNSSCPFVIFLLAIVLSVLLRFTASVYPFGIFKLFLSFCPFSFGHCVVCPSSIYCFCLPLWYHQTLLVLLSFFFWPLRCLSFFDLWILITPLVSSNSSCTFVIFLFAITLSVLRFTASAYRFGIFKVSLFPYDYVIHVYSCDKEHVLRTSRLYKFIYEQSDPIFEGLGRH